MISTFGASPEQAERFIDLYQAKTPIRAAAHEAGISIIQATMIARHSGILRLTEGFIVNSRGAEIGRIGENLFARHLPEAVNTNLSVSFNNPAYDFILNGAKSTSKVPQASRAAATRKTSNSASAPKTNSRPICLFCSSNPIRPPTKPTKTATPTASLSPACFYSTKSRWKLP